jgi:hypothetical protein
VTKKPTPEVVPGMADAIQDRMDELHIGPSRLAREAGITNPGLDPVRKGFRRRYKDSTKHGIARALRWPEDAIDRLMAGEDPAGFIATEIPTVEAAIEADPALTPEAKGMMVSLYRAAVEQSRP